jgi:pimeloyl-ACP methyl ester carboxylesterase
MNADTLRLADGRIASWFAYGPPTGIPVFFFHGWPGSGAQGYFLEEAAQELGVRLISPERPGFGLASPQPYRTFADWPADVSAIADHLGISSFSIMGVSGGGPYALACAALIPERIRQVCVCCGAVPTVGADARRGLHPAYRFLLSLHGRFPALVKPLLVPMTLLGRLPIPWPILRSLMKVGMPSRDYEAMSDRNRFASLEPSFLGAMRSGASALHADGLSYANVWPVDVTSIAVPVTFWHGSLDANFSIREAEKLYRRVPQARWIALPEGHYSLPLFHGRAMLQSLLVT